MRHHIGAVTRVVPLRRHDEPRTPRWLQPRTARETFVPVREESILRGRARAA